MLDCRLRYLTPVVLLCVCAVSAAEPAAESYPLWNGQESVAEYAQRVNLPLTQTLDLGGGVKLELVLIPAGKFIMGTPEPTPVDEEGFGKKIVAGQALLAVGGGVLLVVLGIVLVRAFRQRSRPRFSLARLVVMTVAAGVALLGGLHWRHSIQTLEKAKVEYAAAKARYDFANQSEKPAHPVALTQPFYMGKFVVTQEQYQAVAGAIPGSIKVIGSWISNSEALPIIVSPMPRSKESPMDTVSWYDAQAFCKKVTEQTKQAVRLPTEAEWEYACRAGTASTYHSGDTEADLARAAWYSGNSKDMTHPVGRKEPNVFGLYDMHGNVWQWCQDWYRYDYYSKSPAENPEGPAQDAARVFRGGSWANDPRYCRSACRNWYVPDGCSDLVGFRVVAPASRTP